MGLCRAWLQSRMTVIATLKCVGATSNLIFRVYMLQVLAMAGLGIAGGLVLAGLTPFATTRLFADYVNVPLDPTFYPRPLAIAAAFGFLTRWSSPCGHCPARSSYAQLTFSERYLSPYWLAGNTVLGAIIICCAGLLSLALLATGNIVLSFSFLVGTGIALLFLSGLGKLY